MSALRATSGKPSEAPPSWYSSSPTRYAAEDGWGKPLRLRPLCRRGPRLWRRIPPGRVGRSLGGERRAGRDGRGLSVAQIETRFRARDLILLWRWHGTVAAESRRREEENRRDWVAADPVLFSGASRARGPRSPVPGCMPDSRAHSVYPAPQRLRRPTQRPVVPSNATWVTSDEANGQLRSTRKPLARKPTHRVPPVEDSPTALEASAALRSPTALVP